MSEQKTETKPIKEFPPRQFGSSGEQIFDNRVHIRDESTGRLVKVQPYAYHAFDQMKLWERPIGSGNMFDANGKEIGNWKQTKGGRWEKHADTHIAAKLFHEIKAPEDLAKRNAQLEQELEALKAEIEEKGKLASSSQAKHGKA